MRTGQGKRGRKGTLASRHVIERMLLRNHMLGSNEPSGRKNAEKHPSETGAWLTRAPQMCSAVAMSTGKALSVCASFPLRRVRRFSMNQSGYTVIASSFLFF